MTLEGVEKGTPDLFIAEPKGDYHGLFIELKREDERLSKVSKEQEEKISGLLAKGYHAAICYGASEALKEIDLYLGNNAV